MGIGAKLGCIESNVQYVTSKERISVADIVFEVVPTDEKFLLLYNVLYSVCIDKGF